MIRSLLAIDPGARTGWAAFGLYASGWQLQGAGVVTPDAEFAHRMDLTVIENPVIYPNSRARPADILKLARIVGRYEERFKDSYVELVEPRKWKGTVDGDIMVRRIEAAMTPYEKEVLAAYKGGYRHNAVDAVGLGKWALRQPFMRRVA